MKRCDRLPLGRAHALYFQFFSSAPLQGRAASCGPCLVFICQGAGSAKAQSACDRPVLRSDPSVCTQCTREIATHDTASTWGGMMFKTSRRDKAEGRLERLAGRLLALIGRGSTQKKVKGKAARTRGSAKTQRGRAKQRVGR